MSVFNMACMSVPVSEARPAPLRLIPMTECAKGDNHESGMLDMWSKSHAQQVNKHTTRNVANQLDAHDEQRKVREHREISARGPGTQIYVRNALGAYVPARRPRRGLEAMVSEVLADYWRGQERVYATLAGLGRHVRAGGVRRG